MKEKAVKLSVVIPNYNHASYIREAISAISAQTFKPEEIIIVDDASTDNSIAVIESIISQNPIVKLVKNEFNLGMANSVNRGLEYVSGDYIYITSSDDVVLPGFFEKSMKMLLQYPQAGICSSLTRIIDERGRRKGFILNPVASLKSSYFSPEEVRKIYSRQGSWISGPSSIMRLDYFKENGGYWPQLHAFSDGFLEQLLSLKYGACFMPEPLTCWRKLGTNYSMKISDKTGIYSQLIKDATDLMEKRFQGVFPEEYVDIWRRQNLFYLNYNIYNNKLNERISSLKEHKGTIGRLRCVGLKLGFALQKRLVMCYLTMIFRKNIWRALKNRLIYLYLGIRYNLNEN